MSTLYERLGGASTVSQVVDLFYGKVLSDDRIRGFFENVDMDKQAVKLKAFLTMMFGGPNRYLGKDIREGHKHLVARGLNDSHLDAIIELLCSTLKELSVTDTNIREIAAITSCLRKEVLNR